MRFGGTTPLGTNLDRKVLGPLVVGPARSSQLRKPVLVITITDGEPTGESKDAVRSVITNAKRGLQNGPLGPGAVAFQFAQVGTPTHCALFVSLQVFKTDKLFVRCCACQDLQVCEPASDVQQYLDQASL